MSNEIKMCKEMVNGFHRRNYADTIARDQEHVVQVRIRCWSASTRRVADQVELVGENGGNVRFVVVWPGAWDALGRYGGHPRLALSTFQ